MMFNPFKKKPLSPLIEKIIDELLNTESWSSELRYEIASENTLENGKLSIDWHDYKVRGGYRMAALRSDGTKVLGLTSHEERKLSSAAGTRIKKLIKKRQEEIQASLLQAYGEETTHEQE